jgi:apolipoprotein N-acyltransferase
MGLAGLGMGLGPAPLNLWWMAWVALIPLWYRLRPLTDWRWAGLLGLAWGFGYHGYSLFWITGLHPLTWMGLPWANSVLIAGSSWLFVTFWGALIPSLWAIGLTCANRWWRRRHANRNVLGQELRYLGLGVALWCGLEALWNQSFLWWTSLALTQSDGNRVILHLGQLSGPTAIVASIVGVNGLLALAWASWRQTHQSHQSPLAKTYAAAAITTLMVLHLLGWSLYRLPLPTLAQTQAAQTSLKIGLIQGNIPTRIKLYPQGLAQAMQNYTQGYHQLVVEGVQAVLTPEAALPMMFLWPDATREQTVFWQALQDQAPAPRPIVTWLGSFATTADGAHRTQSLLTLSGDLLVSRYDKIKLVPLGEYIPLQDNLGRWIERLSPIKSSMVAGSDRQRVNSPVGTAIVGICYDSAFTHLFRQQAAAGGEFILTAANNDPYNARMMLQHHAQDVLRAIETDRWAVRATNTGYSAVVNPHGETVWHSQVKTYAVHAETIERRQTQTLYVRWGDWLLKVALLAGVGLLLF